MNLNGIVKPGRMDRKVFTINLRRLLAFPEGALNLKKKLPVKISIPESGKWLDKEYTLDLYKKVMEDKILSKAVDHWAVHSYWSNEVDKK